MSDAVAAYLVELCEVLRRLGSAKLVRSGDRVLAQERRSPAAYMLVDGEPFWGNDRLDLMDRWLETGGW